MVRDKQLLKITGNIQAKYYRSLVPTLRDYIKDLR